MAKKVAVVTGANKSIGYALVKVLCQVYDGDVILTARDVVRGKSAVQKLKEECLGPKFHQLDVTDSQSLGLLKEFIQHNYGGLDVLVNNAGILYTPDATVPFTQQSEETLKVNYFGVMNVCDALFPLLRPEARVCNISSRAAFWCYHKLISDSMRKRLSDPLISKDDLTSIMQSLVQSLEEAKARTVLGFVPEAYGISKLGVTILTRIQQRELEDQGRNSILVNACSPGYVQTDMTQGRGNLTVDEAVKTPLYLCQLPASVDSPRGAMLTKKFFRLGTE